MNLRVAEPRVSPRVRVVRRTFVGLMSAGVLSGLLTPTPASAWSVVDDRGVKVEITRPVHRIVTLTPSLTETVCALGGCDRLVATDRFSQWPAQVRTLPKVGGLEDTGVEQILALRPQVVLVASSTRVIDRLESLGLKVIALEPRTLGEVQRVLDKVAELLDRPQASSRVWNDLQAQIDDAARQVPQSARGQRAYFEVASTPHAASQASFVGELMSRLGLLNIVPAAWGPFPALNAEWVVRSQPDWVMGSWTDIQGMPARPGWSALPAFKHQHTCGFTEAQMDTLMRAGPRLGEGARWLAHCMAHRAAGKAP